MVKFIKLLINEQLKIYIRKSTWAMYIILAILIIGFAALTNTFEDTNKYTEDNWRQELQNENEALLNENKEFQEDTGAEDDDFYISFNMDTIEKNNYYLENDIQPLQYGAWQFTMDNRGLLSVVSLLTIIIAAGIVASEYRWGTIKLLLIRPISRNLVLLSKYISVLLFAFFTLVFVFLFSLIVGTVFFGFEGIDPHFVTEKNEGFAYISVISEIFSGYGYSLVNLVMMATFAFMISSVFRNSTLAIGIAIFLMMAGNSIVSFFGDREWAKYILFANTDLKQYADGNTPWIEGMTMGFSITVLLVYYIIFMALTWVFFTKRDVAGQ
ncbi:ABC transporter permease subunit [Ornithinibacillus sp. L9]|uniref:ABC transporter permease subunit n=1 Tax=Ornithinibacillus caprae TaxID=2678566 RepID=A0A6N8FPH9_9BACI|nr:ABC transporter permease [Ornithinibacillus caprae]MUK89749.1 ABC transporter permease subunit [Ornithinibacillus caprae]